MKLNLFSRLVFASLLAFTVSTFVYFSFGNIYSSILFNHVDFKTQFESGIYQYRILSSQVVLWIYQLLSVLDFNYDIFKLKFYSPNAEPAMYLSFYITNTFFLILSSIIMVMLTDTKNFVATSIEKLLLVSVAIFTIALSQFVIVPYDVSSYFLLLLFFYLLLNYCNQPTTARLLLLVAILALSTLNRESSALSISLAATLLYAKYGFSKKIFLPLAILCGTYLTIYFGIRFFSQTFTTNDGNLMMQNFTQSKNLLGLLFWLIFFIFSLIIAKDQKAVQQILIFHLLALPYILICFYTGILYEIRLYVPLFITSVFLGRTVIPRHSII